MEEYCKGYKLFLDNGKTERMCVEYCIELATARGFKPYERGMKLKAGDKIYVNNRDKGIMLAVIGTQPLDKGANIGAAHTDAPRLDLKPRPLYEDSEIECFFVGNPRAEGHMCIATIDHYHDMSEAPDAVNDKIFRFAKRFMQILCRVYGCERVYLCTMCDGPNNHYHIQLIPRYPSEKRGSRNFVKERMAYRFDPERFQAVRQQIAQYVKERNT